MANIHTKFDRILLNEEADKKHAIGMPEYCIIYCRINKKKSKYNIKYVSLKGHVCRKCSSRKNKNEIPNYTFYVVDTLSMKSGQRSIFFSMKFLL